MCPEILFIRQILTIQIILTILIPTVNENANSAITTQTSQKIPPLFSAG
jgi:hypothetical protein